MPICPKCMLGFDAGLSACPRCRSTLELVQMRDGRSDSTLPWYRIRLWLLSLPCFAAGVVSRVLLLKTDVAMGYPIAVVFQVLWYGLGLALFFLSLTLGVINRRPRPLGWVLFWFLAAASLWSVLSTDPK